MLLHSIRRPVTFFCLDHYERAPRLSMGNIHFVCAFVCFASHPRSVSPANIQVVTFVLSGGGTASCLPWDLPSSVHQLLFPFVLIQSIP